MAENEKDKEQKKEELEVDTQDKSIMQTILEVERKEREQALHKASEDQKMFAEKKEKKREAYGKKLQQEKIELMKQKQGISESTDDEEEKEEKKYTLLQKLDSFVYRNKAMVILGAIFIFLGGFLVYDVLTKKNPDMTVMLLLNDQYFYGSTEKLEEILEEYIEDWNEDGKKIVSVYFMPIDPDNYDQYSQASETKLYAMMQSGKDLLVIADSSHDEILHSDAILYDLSADYPENASVSKYRFNFGSSGLLEDIEYNGTGGEDMYIGIRKVQNGAKYREEMEENFEKFYPVLQKLIEDYSEK